MSNEITWKDLLGQISQGHSLAPRGIVCRELTNVITQWDMRYPVLQCAERKLNARFMVAETLCLLMGSNELRRVSGFCKGISKFSDDGIHLRGVYGPQFTTQVEYVVDCLAKDRYSRQAVMTFWERCPRPSKSVPCTVSVQAMIREDALCLTVYMRSSDAYLGVPYDLHAFSHIGAYILASLQNSCQNVQLGILTLMAGSQHLYETDVEKALKCAISPNELSIVKPLRDFPHPDDLLQYLVATLEDLNELYPVIVPSGLRVDGAN